MATAYSIAIEVPAVLEPAASDDCQRWQTPHANENHIDPYAGLRSESPSVGAHGIHPHVIGLAGAGYAALLLVFWSLFVRDTASGVVLGVISVLMLVYFSLMLGGIVFSDSPALGTQRSFADFLSGEVETATGPVSGRAALWMIAGLPAVLAAMALAIGVIAHLDLA